MATAPAAARETRRPGENTDRFPKLRRSLPLWSCVVAHPVHRDRDQLGACDQATVPAARAQPRTQYRGRASKEGKTGEREYRLEGAQLARAQSGTPSMVCVCARCPLCVRVGGREEGDGGGLRTSVGSLAHHGELLAHASVVLNHVPSRLPPSPRKRVWRRSTCACQGGLKGGSRRVVLGGGACE